MANNKRFFILTGEPGVGKTTLTKKLVSLLTEKGVKTSGFYTEEVRRNGVREGFDVVSLNGVRGRLARDQSVMDGPVKCRVGKYGVLVQEFEKVALPCLEQGSTAPFVLVIDEIGKMEFFSEPFKSRVKEIFDPSSNTVVLATIPIRRGDSIIENIRNNSRSKVWTVTRENRNIIHERLLADITATLMPTDYKRKTDRGLSGREIYYLAAEEATFHKILYSTQLSNIS